MKKSAIAALLPAMVFAFASIASGKPVQPTAQPMKPVAQQAKPAAQPAKPATPAANTASAWVSPKPGLWIEKSEGTGHMSLQINGTTKEGQTTFRSRFQLCFSPEDVASPQSFLAAIDSPLAKFCTITDVQKKGNGSSFNYSCNIKNILNSAAGKAELKKLNDKFNKLQEKVKKFGDIKNPNEAESATLHDYSLIGLQLIGLKMNKAVLEEGTVETTSTSYTQKEFDTPRDKDLNYPLVATGEWAGTVCSFTADKINGPSGMPSPAISNSAGQQNPEDQTFEYNADGRRDPFLSLAYVQKQAQLVKHHIGIPLEDYDLAQFQLLAVVISGHKYAMVKLPNGKYYDLRVGTAAGIYGGHVVSIAQDSVTIVQSVPDFKGVKHNNAVTLRLRKEEE